MSNSYETLQEYGLLFLSCTYGLAYLHTELVLALPIKLRNLGLTLTYY
ncbi:hypothetical protein [Nostoc sp.]